MTLKKFKPWFFSIVFIPDIILLISSENIMKGNDAFGSTM